MITARFPIFFTPPQDCDAYTMLHLPRRTLLRWLDVFRGRIYSLRVNRQAPAVSRPVASIRMTICPKDLLEHDPEEWRSVMQRTMSYAGFRGVKPMLEMGVHDPACPAGEVDTVIVWENAK